MNVTKTLLVIAGPTASGKTALSISLAKFFNTAVISADSRQFYKEISIGTAKPSKEEQDGIPHYYIDSHSIQDCFTVADYEREVISLLRVLFETHDYVVLVGGSGLFIDAVCYGLDDFPSDKQIKKELIEWEKREGMSGLLQELKEKDSDYYTKVDKKNPVRVIRALEIIRVSNKRLSDLILEKEDIVRDFDVTKCVIDLPREILYERINSRVESMMESGLLDEVKAVSLHKKLQTLNTVGYSELFSYLDGVIDLEEAIRLIKQNSRRYAKRQLTWFRRDTKSIWLKNQNTEDLFSEILQILGIKKG